MDGGVGAHIITYHRTRRLRTSRRVPGRRERLKTINRRKSSWRKDALTGSLYMRRENQSAGASTGLGRNFPVLTIRRSIKDSHLRTAWTSYGGSPALLLTTGIGSL